ncbi:hypothetical protein QQS21_003564 [Conoideocrella luteorostrata]|uniref:DUF159 domain protein n=1 Tax=Conoideocrella luteorostrata TaxID=1105319 RepID=A0AAJ0CT74_9HYPO|nr:hypothetical protein QQS21_003564 [Conoideocrella luteorostrata]
MSVDDSVDEDGPSAPRQSYNFAPGYHGVVYRADTPDWGSGPRSRAHRDRDATGEEEKEEAAAAAEQQDEVEGADSGEVKYKLQSMKWGLVPFWTKRNPDYQTLMRTINCRDDSLSTPGGMWASMKNKKRCIVIAQGFFEWLKTGPKDKLPHFVKRKDGRLMCFAGLWDCVQYEGSDEKLYTYTIITTDSNKQLKFLHDRMPVIFNPGSDKIKQWVDPSRYEWSRELQSLLQPFDGELEVYPVSKDVGKVGNNSPSFIIPLNSKENRSNIANFFSNAEKKIEKKELVAEDGDFAAKEEIATKDEDDSKRSSKESPPNSGLDTAQEKRKIPPTSAGSPPSKKIASGKAKISATKNEYKSPKKSKAPGSQKITSFFGNSA